MGQCFWTDMVGCAEDCDPPHRLNLWDQGPYVDEQTGNPAADVSAVVSVPSLSPGASVDFFVPVCVLPPRLNNNGMAAYFTLPPVDGAAVGPYGYFSFTGDMMLVSAGDHAPLSVSVPLFGGGMVQNYVFRPGAQSPYWAVEGGPSGLFDLDSVAPLTAAELWVHIVNGTEGQTGGTFVIPAGNCVVALNTYTPS